MNKVLNWVTQRSSKSLGMPYEGRLHGEYVTWIRWGNE